MLAVNIAAHTSAHHELGARRKGAPAKHVITNRYLESLTFFRGNIYFPKNGRAYFSSRSGNTWIFKVDYGLKRKMCTGARWVYPLRLVDHGFIAR